ncbi:cytochrome subunit of sulfide dehydrogenase [Hyphomicrobium sp. 1Nfss2.1]|uniref:c-type cytochrome n=1 Tax=Hyphomicrobium sp. 1Nfss2.1 TaxID=3413936 RepID=UPI003C7CA837
MNRLRMRFRIIAQLLAVSACAATFAHANEDVEYGAYLSSECVTCHHAQANGKIPSLDGRPPQEIVTHLSAFKTGARQSSVMQQIASRLSDAEMMALAAYFASLATSIECKETTQPRPTPC